MGQKDQVLAYMAKRIVKLDRRCRELARQLNAQGDRARAAERLCGEQEATINWLRADNAGLGQALIDAQRQRDQYHAERNTAHQRLVDATEAHRLRLERLSGPGVGASSPMYVLGEKEPVNREPPDVI